MEPLSDALDVNVVTGATTWDVPLIDHSEEIILPVHRSDPAPTFVVNLPSRVTAKQARTLARDFRRDLDVDQPWIILDLSEVKEMDTAGLDLLVECLKETLSRDGKVRLRGISPEAATILELTGVDRVLNMFSEADLCVSHSGAPPPETLLEEQTPEQIAA